MVDTSSSERTRAESETSRSDDQSPRYVSRLTKDTLALILAGGRGSRLYELTAGEVAAHELDRIHVEIALELHPRHPLVEAPEGARATRGVGATQRDVRVERACFRLEADLTERPLDVLFQTAKLRVGPNAQPDDVGAPDGRERAEARPLGVLGGTAE